jgi:hypothetical protein
MSEVCDDIVFALRFATVAFVNVLCWKLFSLFGLLSKFDKALINQETDFIQAVLLVLLPPSLNPVLFILKRVKEKRRREEARLLAILRQMKNAVR